MYGVTITRLTDSWCWLRGSMRLPSGNHRLLVWQLVAHPATRVENLHSCIWVCPSHLPPTQSLALWGDTACYLSESLHGIRNVLLLQSTATGGGLAKPPDTCPCWLTLFTGGASARCGAACLTQSDAADALIHWQLLREMREPRSNFTCSSSSLLTDGCVRWRGHMHSFRLRNSRGSCVVCVWRKSAISWKLKWVTVALIQGCIQFLTVSLSTLRFASTVTYVKVQTCSRIVRTETGPSDLFQNCPISFVSKHGSRSCIKSRVFMVTKRQSHSV